MHFPEGLENTPCPWTVQAKVNRNVKIGYLPSMFNGSSRSSLISSSPLISKGLTLATFRCGLGTAILGKVSTSLRSSSSSELKASTISMTPLSSGASWEFDACTGALKYK